MKDTAISLYELNNLVRGVIQHSLSDYFWVRAEMSDVRVNQNGHCYLEFIEKDDRGRNIVAKSRGMIWANTFFMLREYFESTTQQIFASGLKVLVKVSVDFHELYGFSLTVHDIDPSYTLGDQARNRAEILKQLKEDGVLELNKELALSNPTNRIAVISSPTAAGYEDFCDQLENNSEGYVFYTKLFAAIMQGDRAEDSIISALERIYEYQDCFDTVVIIRGGGATSDLSCFDSYMLAASCAQFPLPIITGIGHERDETVLDVVAHTRAKTPTAVAEFLINRMNNLAVLLENMQLGIVTTVKQHLQTEMLLLNTFETKSILWLKNWSRNQNQILATISDRLKRVSVSIQETEGSKLNVFSEKLKRESHLYLKDHLGKLENYEKVLNLLSPDNLLKKGYSITLKNGKAVKKLSDVSIGDTLTTITAEGEIESIVK